MYVRYRVYWTHRRTDDFQATVEKVLKCLNEDKKDVRKGDWTNKEVNHLISLPPALPFPLVHSLLVMTKSMLLESNPAHRGGSNAPHAFEINFVLTTTQRLRSFLNDRNTDVSITYRSTS